MKTRFFSTVVIVLGLVMAIMAPASFARNPGADHLDRVTVQQGTTLRANLETTLSTKTTHTGDRFTARVREPIYADGALAIPYGSTIEGRVSEVQRPGHIHGVGKLDIAFERIILPNGESAPLVAITRGAQAHDKTKVDREGEISGPSSRKREAAEIAAGGGIGAGIGAIAGGGKGTAIGGGAGALIGLADSMRRRGKDLELPAGTTLIIQLERPLTVEPSRDR